MLLSVFLADVTKEIDNTANDIHKNVFNRGDIAQLVANYYVSVLLTSQVYELATNHTTNAASF